MTTAEKSSLSELIGSILNKNFISKSETVKSTLQELKRDIDNDFYTVVVLGEFKRGKSTFINALLKENLLTSDILPETATINALMYSENPQLFVVMNDGSVREGQPTNEYLKQFSAQGDKEIVNNVKYIKIGYNADILKNKIVIVDTPGVSDINEQRCEVTYRFIPKANVVLFLLDANSPLKLTEKEFVEKRLIQTGIDNIVFIVNKYDNVDEEEDENFLDDLRQKLYRVFCVNAEVKLKDLRVLPLSAKWALQGALTNNAKMIAASGINEVEAEIKSLVTTGRVEEEKVKRYKIRLKTILSSVYADLENKRAMMSADIDSLRQANNGLNALLAEQNENKINIQKYVDSEKANILPLIDKSLHYFYKRLEENITDQIQFYKAMDFKEYVEQRISKVIQREMENWVAVYSPNVERLLKNLENEIARGMSYRFQQKVKLEANAGSELKTRSFMIDLNAQDVSKASVKAGVIAAGGAGIMMLIGGPILMPFISMAAFPFLQRRFLEEQLAQAKDQIIPVVQEQIAQYIFNLKQEIHSYVDTRCSVIVSNSEAAYEIILSNLQMDIEKQIREKETTGQNLSVEVQNLTNNINELQTIMQEL